MAVKYPNNWPIPRREGYSVAVNVGLRVVTMNAGNTRTRRKSPARLVRQVELNFDMTQSELVDWSEWVNQNGYTWFVMPLVSDKYDADPVDHTVKLISNWTETYLSPDIWNVRVSAEILA